MDHVEWIAAGRGVRVWINQEMGINRSNILTPGDVTTPPHWSYTLQSSKVLHADDITFFEKIGVYNDGSNERYTWTDTPAGLKAAQLALINLPANNGDYPNKFAYNYTIEPIVMVSEQKRADGRALTTHYLIAIIQWSAKIN